MENEKMHQNPTMSTAVFTKILCSELFHGVWPGASLLHACRSAAHDESAQSCLLLPAELGREDARSEWE